MKHTCSVTSNVISVALLSLLGFVPMAAFGVPITFEFSGQGNCGAEDPCPDVIGDDLSVSGSFTFDSEAMDLEPADDTEGLYVSTGGVFGINYQFGLLHGESDTVRIFVQDFGDFDIYFVTDSSGNFALQLWALSNGFDSDALPLEPPALDIFNDFFEADLTMRFAEYPFATFGFLDSFTVGVAEPGPLLLWGFGLGALLFGRRFWRRTNDHGASYYRSQADF